MAEAPRRRLLPLISAITVVLAAVLVWSDPASAHVDFTGSEPADGAVVNDPVRELRFDFSGPISAVPEQVFVFDGDGQPLGTTDVAVEGDTTLVVTPAEPLAGGRFGAQWAVRAGDSHPRTGAITFEVTAPPAPPPTTAAEPGVDQPDAPAGAALPDGTSTTAITDDAMPSEGSTDPSASEDDALLGALAAAQSESNDGVGDLLGGIGRFVAYAGILLAVGALAFIAWIFEGRRSEVTAVCRIAVVGAVLAIAGSVVEAAGLSASLDDNTLAAAVDPGAWANLGDTDAWIGFVLRLAGGLLVAATAYSVRSGRTRGADRRRRTGEAAPAVAERGTVSTAGRAASVDGAAITRDERRSFQVSPASMIGALALLASGAFIGHTASESPRALVAASDFAHLAAASVWVGGAVALATTLSRRKRAGVEADAALLASRFSVSATWSVILVALTGAAMAWAILPDPAALTSSAFGQILLVKVALVAGIAGIGAYNHFAIVPRIRSGEPQASRRLRATLGVEAIAFVFVIAATAALVGASPT